MWSEHSTGLVKQLQPNGSTIVLHRLPPPIYDLKLVSAAQEDGTHTRILEALKLERRARRTERIPCVSQVCTTRARSRTAAARSSASPWLRADTTAFAGRAASSGRGTSACPPRPPGVPPPLPKQSGIVVRRDTSIVEMGELPRLLFPILTHSPMETCYMCM